MANGPVSLNAATLMGRKPDLVEEIAAAVTFGFVLAAGTGAALMDRLVQQRGQESVTQLGEVPARLAEYMGAVQEFMEALPPDMEDLDLGALSELLQAVLGQFDLADRLFLSLYDEVVPTAATALDHLGSSSWVPDSTDIEPLVVLTERCAEVMEEIEASGVTDVSGQDFLEDEDSEEGDIGDEEEDAGRGPLLR